MEYPSYPVEYPYYPVEYPYYPVGNTSYPVEYPYLLAKSSGAAQSGGRRNGTFLIKKGSLQQLIGGAG